MLKKPAKIGMPASASEPTTMVRYVQRIFARRLPMKRMSCSPPAPWMTEPEPMNSRPLKKPWLTRWKMAATHAPMPSAKNMYASWLTVE